MYGFLALVVGLASLIDHQTYCQEANFGKKVPCFIVQDSTVCPGCNIRGGLTCPRSPEGTSGKFESCEVSTEQPTTTEQPTDVNNETTVTLPYDYDKMETSFVKNKDIMLYLYNYLGPVYKQKSKHVVRTRSADDDAGLEICRWNGDCPCPLICCRRGAGCPRRCVPGRRLPPHIRPYGK